MYKIILDLCGGTGAWSRPYKEAGYDVRLVTLPEYDVTDVVFASSYMVFNKQNYAVNDMGIKYSDVYGILAAPPCTEFSLAKNGSPTPRDLRAGMEIVEACIKIIWQCQSKTKLKFWALENPLGLLRRFLGRPKFTFRQWEFGDPGVKPTDIWGFFNEPKRTVKEKPEGITKRYKSGKVNTLAWAAPKPPDWVDASNLTRADLRAITPPEFAKAFFKANR
jgi:hypothetical protein